MKVRAKKLIKRDERKRRGRGVEPRFLYVQKYCTTKVLVYNTLYKGRRRRGGGV
jgi:hypothetical protein